MSGEGKEEERRQQEMERAMREGMTDALKRLTKRGRMELVSPYMKQRVPLYMHCFDKIVCCVKLTEMPSGMSHGCIQGKYLWFGLHDRKLEGNEVEAAAW